MEGRGRGGRQGGESYGIIMAEEKFVGRLGRGKFRDCRGVY